ncbi:MAG: RNA degradosome polyphosphate kinase, partial [Clostridiales bacterium]|nr:RNA degradosome polyphosphate kinase [Clostridiales bacterium]
MDLFNPEYYFNRELSWLEFNNRVLEEAQDKSNLLMERLKFLAISASNLDEFFMVRVSNLWDQAGSKRAKNDPSGLTPRQQLRHISRKVHDSVTHQYNCLIRSILPALTKEGIRFLNFKELNDNQRETMTRYYKSTVYPILTPMAIDRSRPFPLLNNKTLNVIVELSAKDQKDKKDKKRSEDRVAVLQIPTVISRVIS